MKNLLFSCLLYFIMTPVQAQFLITPFAGTSSNENQSISHSGGETVIATLGNNNIFITQGFQQQFMPSKIKSISIPSLIEDNGKTVTEHKLVFGGDDFSVQTISHFLIYNASGQIFYQKKDFELIEFQEWWSSSFNGRSLSGGIYFYFIEYEEQGQTQMKTGSITKF